jgi:dinuclear metal center YbgI/SA1388 family protein
LHRDAETQHFCFGSLCFDTVVSLAELRQASANSAHPAAGSMWTYAAPVPRLADVIAVLNHAYDPTWAAEWDAVGLVCGDPDATVAKIMFAVDPVEATVDEALGGGVDLLVAHHPLLLTGVHGVPASDPKGRLVHRLIAGGCALFVVHTNADVAMPGVSDALAEAIGLEAVSVLEPDPSETWEKIVVFVPMPAVEVLIDAMAAAGAGAFGAYDRCAWTTAGEGTFRPGPAANPTIGVSGVVERVPEARVEMVLPRSRRGNVIAAVRAVHPYEEPAFDLYRLDHSVASSRGTGRIGQLPEPTPLPELVHHVATVLPATAAGVRATGRPDAVVSRVAVCGGSGGAYAELARAAGADAYLTSDLRHHVTSEVVERSGPASAGQPSMAMIDAAHWATEWPWLPVAAERLRADLAGHSTTVDVRVSSIVTDPWTHHVDTVGSSS